MSLRQYRFELNVVGSKLDLTGTAPIRGVSLIAMGEAKGHGVYVDKVCLSQVFNRLRQLGDLKVKEDHGSGSMSTIGYMDNFSMSPDGTKVLGDFHVYDSEPNKPRILEIAQKKPHHLGMSLEFEGVDQTLNGKTFARCSDISAVALVSDPAANRSLFSSVERKNVDSSEPVHSNLDMATNFREIGRSRQFDAAPDEKKPMDPVAQSAQMADPSVVPDKQPSDPQEKAWSLSQQDFQKMMDQMTDMSSRMAKYEAGINPKIEDSKPAPPSINPNAQPKADNDGPTMKNGETGANAAPNPVANPKGPWEQEEKRYSAKQLEEAAQKGAQLAFKQFAARTGIRPLPANAIAFAGVAGSTQKSFDELVTDKTRELESRGDKNASTNAMIFCLKNHKTEYALSRNVSTPPKTLGK